MNWYIACSGVNLEIGGNTPYASQVRRKIFLGIFPTEGIIALSI
jgi:hypothetical protein